MSNNSTRLQFKFLIVLMMTVVLFLVGSVSELKAGGTNNTWNGSVSSDWSTAGNWSRVGAGTLTSSTSSTSVTGSGTSFGTAPVVVGARLFQADGVTFIGTIASIASATSLTLSANAAVAQNNLAYGVGVVPVSGTDNLIIPSGLSNYPVLSQNSACRTITSMGNGSSISGNFSLTPTNAPAIAVTGNASISCNLAGTVAYSMSNAGSNGTLTLSGTNTFNTTFTVTTGVLKITNGSALGATSAGTVVSSGAALQLEGGITVGAEPLSLAGTGISTTGALRNISGTNTWGGLITLTANTEISSDAGTLNLDVASGNAVTGTFNLTLDGAGDISVADVIATGTGTLTKAGSGTVTLSGANTYTGAVAINAGILKLGASSTVNTSSPTGTTGVITVANGATLDMNGFSYTSGHTQAITINGTGVSGVGAITNSSSTASTLVGPITFATAATISGEGAQLNITGTPVSSAVAITLGGAAGGSISTVIAGARTLTKVGAGTWELSGLNTYTGTTSVDAGFLRATNNTVVASTNGPFGNNASGLILNGGTIQSNVATFSRPITVSATNSGLDAFGSARTISSSITMASGTMNLNVGGTTVTSAGGQDLTLSGVISNTAGTLSITKIGTSIVIPSGNNSYSGTTTVSAGTFRLGAAGNSTNTPLGTTGAGTTVDSGASLDLNGFTLGTAEALTLNGTGISGGGALMNSGDAASYSGLITLGSASSIVGGTGTINVSNTGTISGATFGLTLGGAQGGTLASILGTTSGTLTKEGTGTWTLSGASTYSGGTTLSAGTLNINNAGSAGTSSAIGTGTLTINGGTINNSTSSAISISTNNALTINSNFTFTGTQSLNLGTGTVTLPGNTTGTITVSGSTLTIGGAINQNTFSLTKEGAGTLALGSQLVIISGLTVSAGTFVSTSATLSLAGNFSNSGTFTHNSGTVEFNGGTQTIGGSATTFNNLIINSSTSTTLGVASNVAGALTVKSGSTLGLSTFSLGATTAPSSLAMESGGNVSGSTITGSGTLTLGGNLTVSNLGSGSSSTGATIGAPIALGANRTFDIEDSPNVANDLVFSLTGGISGNFDILKTGAGTIQLASINSFKNLTISNGYVYGNVANAFGTTGTITLGDASTSANNYSAAVGAGSGATFTISRPIVVADQPTSGTYTLKSNAAGSDPTFSGGITMNQPLVIESSSTNSGKAITISGGITANGNLLTKNGAGLLVAGANLSLSGAFTITDGQFDANSFTTTVTGLTTLSGGTYRAGSGTQTFNGGLTLSGGTYEGLSGTAGNTSTTDLTISSGTFSAPGSTGTFSVSGNFTNSATFNANSGIVTLNGSGTQSINSGGSSFANLSITNTSGTVTATSNDITVTGTLTTSANSVLDMGSNALFVETTAHSGILKTTNTSSTPFTSGKTWGGTVEFYASAIQTIPSGTFQNLTISNTTGGNQKTASAGVVVNDTLNLASANASTTKGALDIPSGYLDLGVSAVVRGTGNITGTVRRSHLFTQTGSLLTFTGANQGLVLFNLPDQTGNPLTLYINATMGAPISTTGCTMDTPPNPLSRYYTIWREGSNWGSATSSFRHYYLDSELPEGVNESSLSVWKKDQGVSPCTVQELGVSNSNTTLNFVGIAKQPITNFISEMQGNTIIFAAPTQVAILEWNGSTSTAMTTADNWTPQGVPSSGVGLVIPHDVTFTYNPVLPDNTTLSAKSLLIETGKTLTSGTNSILKLVGTGQVFSREPGATFVQGNSTILIESGGVSSIAGTVTLNNLTVASGSTLLVPGEANLTISGTLTNNGIIDANTPNTVTFSGTGQTIPNTSSGKSEFKNLVISGANTVLPSNLDLYGNFTYSGTGLNVGNSTLTMKGGETQTITATHPLSLYNLTISNTDANIPEVNLESDLTVTDTLLFINGKINTGANRLILPLGATLSGISASSYIQGTLRRFIPNTAAPSIAFPIGDDEGYRPVLVDFVGTVSGSGYLDASTETASPGVMSGIDQTKFVSRKWTLTNSGVADFTSFSPTFTFASGEIQGGADFNKFIVRKLDGTVWSATTTGTKTATSTQSTGLTSFSEFYIGEPAALEVANQPANQQVCEGSMGVTFSSSSNASPPTSIQWYRDAGSGFEAIDGAMDEGIYTGFNSITLTISAAALELNGYQYHARFSNINGEVSSDTAELTVFAASVGGSLTGTDTVCSGTNNTELTLSGETGSIIRWEYSTDGGTSWATIPHTALSFTAENLTVTTRYRVVVKNGTCSEAFSSEVTVTVDPVTVPGSVTGVASVCTGTNSTLLTLEGNNGSVVDWEFSTNGTDWTSLAITSSSYTATNLTNTTLYRAKVQSGVCAPAYTDPVTITVDPASVAGTATASDAEICGGTNTTVTLSSFTGTIQWQQSLNGTDWESVSGGSGQTSATLTTPALTVATYFRAAVTSGACSTVFSNAVEVSILAGSAGIISFPQNYPGSVCTGTNSTTLTLSGYTGGLTAIVKWQKLSTDGLTWIDIDNTAQSEELTLTNLTETSTYRVDVNVEGCGDVYTTPVTIQVDPASVGGTAAATSSTLCEGESTSFTLTGYTGSIQWQQSPNGTDSWVDVTTGDGGTTDEYTTASLTQTTYFRAKVTSGVCSVAYSNVLTIAVNPRPAAPVAGGVTAAYTGNEQTATATAPDGSTVVWYDAETGGNVTTAPAATNAGTYTAWAASQNTTTGCESIARTLVTLTITPIALSVTADDQSKIYDGVGFNAFTYTITGFVEGENENNISGIVSYAGAALTAIIPGAYTITPVITDLSATNYSFTAVDGTLTITTRELTVADLTAQNKSYDGTTAATASGTPMLVGIVTGDEVELTGTPEYNFTTANVGTGITVTTSGYALTGADADKYSLIQPTFTANITVRALTVTALPQNKSYGTTAPVSGILNTNFEVTGLQGSDVAGGVTLSYSGDPAGNLANASVGTYDITPSEFTLSVGILDNYNISYASGVLTVSGASLTVTAVAQSKTYGATAPTTGELTTHFTVSGLLLGDVAATVSLTYDGTPTGNLPIANVGTYTITPSSLVLSTGAANNYSITYETAVLTVNQALATVTAVNQSKTYGESAPTTGELITHFTVSGLLNTDEANEVILTYSGDPAGNLPTAAVGTYTITPSGLSLASGSVSNYDFTYIPATLTINTASLTVTASAQSKNYGGTAPTSGTLNTNFTVTGLLNTDAADGVTFSYSGSPAGNLATAPVGTYTITPSGLTLSSGSSANYIINYVTGTLTVSAAELTVTASAQSKTYGSTAPTSGTLGTNFTVSGLQNSDAASGVTLMYSGTPAGNLATAAVGSYTITPSSLTLSAGSASNYIVTYNTGTLTVNPAGLTVTALPQTKPFNTTAPTVGTVDVHFSVTGLLNIDAASSVTLSYSGSPAGNLEEAALGTYTITPSVLILSPGSVSNYDITYNTGTLTVVAGAAAKLTIATIGNQTAGTPFSVIVETRDAGDNITSVSVDTEVSLSLASGTGVPGGTLTGTILTGNTSVTIMGVSYTKAESISLTASQMSVTPSLTDGTSNSFTVGHAGLDTFLIEDPAGGSVSNQTISTDFQIRITAQDAYGNTVTTFSGAGNTVDITSTATLATGGGTTAAFSNGVLTSHTLRIGTKGLYTITATRTGGTETGTSNSFRVGNNYYLRASANWNLNSTWSTAGFGGAAASSFPVEGDNAFIGGGFTVTLARNEICETVTFPSNNAQAGTLTISTFRLDVTGDVVMAVTGAAVTRTIAVGTGILNAGSITISGASTGVNQITVSTGTINVDGDVTFNSGSVATTAVINTSNAANINIGGSLIGGAGNGQLTLVNTANWRIGGNYSFNGTLSNGNRLLLTLNGLGDQEINGDNRFRTLTINKNSGTATALKAITIDNVGLNVTNGTLDLSTFTHTGAGTLTVSNGAFLKVGGTRPLPTFTTYTMGATSTVEYYGGNQNLTATAFGNLTLSGTGGKTFPTGTTIVNGVLSIENGANANTFTGLLAYGVNATLQYNAGTSNRTVSTEWPATFTSTGGVIIGGTGIITLNGAKVLDLNDPLTINSGATLNTSASNHAITFGGNFINNGTLAGNASNITIANTMADQNIGGFTTTGIVSFTKTSNSATLQGNVNGGSLIINGNGGTLNLGGNRTHTFTGNWTRTAGTLNGGSSTLRIGGDIDGTGGNFVAGTGTIEFNGSGAQFIPAYNYYNLSSSNNGSRTYASDGTIGISGTFTPGSNSSTVTGSTINFNASDPQTIPAFNYNNLTSSSTGARTLASVGTVVVAGTFTPGSNNYTVTGSTVEFNGAAQTIPAFNYNNLTLSGSGAKTLPNVVLEVGGNLVTSGTATANAEAAITILGNVSIESGTTFTAGSFTHSVGGSWSQSGTFNATGSTIDFNGSGAGTIESGNFNNITFSGAGVKTVTGTISIVGDWINNGTFLSDEGTVIFNGASAQNIGGPNETIFHNLSLSNTTSGVNAGNNITVNGVLTLDSNPSNDRGQLEMTIDYGDYANGAYTTDPAYELGNPLALPNTNTDLKNNTSNYNNLNSYILTMGANSVTVGSGDVTGKIRRSAMVLETTYTFGNANTQLTFSQNTPPAQITVVSTMGNNRGVHIDKQDAVKRLYQVVRVGGNSATRLTLRLAYNDGNLNGNTNESKLVLWDHHIPYAGISPHEHGKTSINTTANYVELSNHGLGYLATEGDVNFTKYWQISEQIKDVPTWIGAVNVPNPWNINSNWSSGTVPDTNSTVVIPDTLGTPVNAVLPNHISLKSIIIQDGGSLDANDFDITLTGGPDIIGGVGTWINNGLFVPGNGKVIFSNSNATIAGTTQFNDLEVAENTLAVLQPNSYISIKGVLDPIGTLDASSDNNTVRFNKTDGIQEIPGNQYFNLVIGEGSEVVLAAGTDISIKGGLDITGILDAFANENTIRFNKPDGGQSIPGNVYYNLTLANTSGIQTASGDIQVENLLSNNSGGTLNMGSDTLVLIQGLNNEGSVIQTQGFIKDQRSVRTFNGEIIYNNPNGGQSIVAGNYETLSLNTSTGTQTAMGNVVSDSLNVSLNTTLNMGIYALEVTRPSHEGVIKTQNEGSTPVSAGKSWGGTIEYNAAGSQSVVSGIFNNIKLSGSSLKTISAGTQINGVLSMNGTASASGITPEYGTNAVLQYAGMVAQTTSDVEFPGVGVPNLKLMNNNGLSLNSNKLVKGTLQFVVGKIATGGHTLTVGEDCEAVGSIVGSGEGKYVNGKLRRYVASASDPGVYFPIGDTSNFTPVTIDFSGDLSSEACGYLEASTMVQGPAEGALPAGAGLSPVKYANRRWKIDNSGVGGFSEYAITLRYNVNDLAGNANPALLSMRKFSGGAWSNVSIGARGLNSAKGIGLTSFSEFVLGESCDIEALSCILDDLCQTGDGAIEILVSGGEAPYTVSAEGVYQSPHPQAGNAVNISIPIKSGIVDKANFTGLPGNAVYSFTITDAKGCVIE